MNKKNYEKLAKALKDNLQRRKEPIIKQEEKQEIDSPDDHNKNSRAQP